MKFKLFIDTSVREKALVRITHGNKKWKKEIKTEPGFTSQVILPLIHEIFEEHAIALQDISEIAVHTAPGSFTGIRVGVAVANTLGLLLGIPVNGKKMETITFWQDDILRARS